MQRKAKKMITAFYILSIIMALLPTACSFAHSSHRVKKPSTSIDVTILHNGVSRWGRWGSYGGGKATTALLAQDEKTTESKAAPVVSGGELEVMLTEWDTPLVLDAYATWCGPCMIMAPEFEAAAKALKDRVRFVKLDTDADPVMASRLNIMGLPTLMFLKKYEGDVDEEVGPRATLLQRIEGAISKDSIVSLCEHLFFNGPMPDNLQ